MEVGGRGWGGAKSYDGEKAWSSINHSILSVLDRPSSKDIDKTKPPTTAEGGFHVKHVIGFEHKRSGDFIMLNC